jgi:peroxiredoxin Q/BCP
MLRPTLRPWVAYVVVLLGLIAAACAACGHAVRPDGGEGLLPIGAPAPDLAGLDQHGASHRLSDDRGHPVVVYFYPKDGTPGCTKQACAFRDAFGQYEDAGVKLYGVSADDRSDHLEFSKEHGLPFPLIADPDFVWAKAFGVSATFGMMERVSFLIDPAGRVAKVYPNVDPGVNATELLADALPLSSKK